MTLQAVDFTVLDFIQQQFRHPFLDWIMPLITHLGDHGILWILIAAVCVFFASMRSIGLRLSVALLIDLILCNVSLKPIVHRLRPCHINPLPSMLIPCPTDFSFPSGHTMPAFITATIFYAYNKPLGIALYILAVLTGFSRLYLYVHFPSDVLFSAVVGILIGLWVHRILSKQKFSF